MIELLRAQPTFNMAERDNQLSLSAVEEARGMIYAMRGIGRWTVLGLETYVRRYAPRAGHFALTKSQVAAWKTHDFRGGRNRWGNC